MPPARGNGCIAGQTPPLHPERRIVVDVPQEKRLAAPPAQANASLAGIVLASFRLTRSYCRDHHLRQPRRIRALSLSLLASGGEEDLRRINSRKMSHPNPPCACGLESLSQPSVVLELDQSFRVSCRSHAVRSSDFPDRHQHSAADQTGCKQRIFGQLRSLSASRPARAVDPHGPVGIDWEEN